jgi:hypothetical protein
VNQPLDPSAAERVLRRASELAHREAARPGMDPEALVAAAAEVGIPVAAVQRALAIERLGPLPASARADAIAGPRWVVADREVPLGVDAAMRSLDGWFVAGNHLRRDRATANTGEWSRRTDPAAALLRAVRGLSGEARLGTASRVTATSAEVDASHTMVRVGVDRSAARAGFLGAGASAAAVGVGAGTVAGLLMAPVAFAVAPIGLAAGVALALQGRRQARRIGREVARVLDAVADGRPPDRVREQMARALRRG